MKPIDRILLTGAAGALGQTLRPFLADQCAALRVTDIAPMAPADAHEEVVQGDISDPKLALELTRDVDAVVYMAGKGNEGTFDEIFRGHTIGLYNIFEGARRNGVRRVIWASSIHATGLWPFGQTLGTDARPRPDSTYGIAKACGEMVAQCYWEKYGIEAISIRICSCFPEPRDRRHLSTWLSYPDLKRLVAACLTCTRPDHTVIWGVSANTHCAHDNAKAAHIGYRPQDDAESYRAAVEARTPPYAADDRAIAFHGGVFATAPHHGD